MNNTYYDAQQEYFITIFFYSCCGVILGSKYIEGNKLIFNITVPDNTNLVLNGTKAPFGKELGEIFKETTLYYYEKFKKLYKGNNDLNKEIDVKYTIRKELWDGNRFRYSLNSKKNNCEQLNINYENIINSIEYIGENGIRVDLNKLIGRE